jgi:hypothetical protein
MINNNNNNNNNNNMTGSKQINQVLSGQTRLPVKLLAISGPVE